MWIPNIVLFVSIIWLLFTQIKGCQFYPPGEYLRFVRVAENLPIGGTVLLLEVHPRDSLTLQAIDKTEDVTYFSYEDINATTIAVTLSRSLENIVDSDQPQNILKFKLGCNYQEGDDSISAFMSVTVYVEDINDHAPRFVNEPYNVRVDELTPAGVTIFRDILAKDRDKPNTPNSDIQYSISSEHQGIFGLESTHRPNLILKRSLDYDLGPREYTFTIYAADRGTPRRSRNTTIHVMVMDNDDLDPKFTEAVYRTHIPEFYPITGKHIHEELVFHPMIEAFDQDRSLNSKLRYDIISGNERNLFALDLYQGKLYLEKEIDLEEEIGLPGNTFVLQVQATQLDNPLRTAVARVEVEILDINDNLPEFEVDFYNISIVENLPNGFSVLQVVATDRDQGENSEFTYGIVGDKPPGAFSVDSRTGWLTVQDQGLLDREKRGSLSLGVRANEKKVTRNNSNQSTVNVEITLLDANDNNPIFLPSNLYEFVVPRDAKIGEVVGTVIARDPDLGRNGMIKYNLQRPRNNTSPYPFHLNTESGTITVAKGSFSQHRYALFVEASDQPTNPSERRVSLAVVTVDITRQTKDKNNFPEFIGAPYEFWVGANVGIGTSIGHIRMSGDVDQNEVVYDMLHGYHEGVPFAVEERSGTVTVVRDISNFERPIYDFEAVASHPSSDIILVTNITIHVVDPDDERGILMRGTGSSPIEFRVRENLPGALIGQLLYRNASMDSLSGNVTKSLRFIIANQQDVTDSIAIGSDGTLYTKIGLDRESRDIFRITVIAEYNKGIISGAGIYQVTIYVDDENDNPPVFGKKSYIGMIFENSYSGTEVTLNELITAKDSDLEENGKFTIVILGEGHELFLVKQETGKVIYNGKLPLDREKIDTYNLRLIAEDKGGLSSEAKLIINIEDINDNAPSFSQLIVLADQGIQILEYSGQSTDFVMVEELKSNSTDMYTMVTAKTRGNSRTPENLAPLLSLPENIPIGTPILKLKAEDKDIGKNSVISFSVLSETFIPSHIMPRHVHMRHYFMVGARDGEIRVARPLPAEAELRLNITAKDSGGLTDNVTIRFLVKDVNDHAPVFKKSLYNFDVNEAIYSREILGKIEATDEDFDQNSNVTYGIVSDEELPFSISELSGVLSVNGELDREERDSYAFSVRALDNAPVGSRLSSTVDVEVHVLDVNDNSPKFYGHDDIIHVPHPESYTLTNHNYESVMDIPVYHANIAENIPIGTPVTRLFANDSDFAGNGNGLLLFDIPQRKNHQHLFTIDSKEGIVTTTGKLDYELNSLYNLTVLASDLGNPRLTSTAMLVIQVVDIPEDGKESLPMPMFLHRYYEVEVEENLPSPIELIKLNVTDFYKESNLRFNIVPDDDNVSNTFNIDQENGTIFMMKSLDREIQDTYYLKVRVDKPKISRNLPVVMLYPIQEKKLLGLSQNEVKVVVKVKDVNDNAPKFTGNGRPIVAVIPSSANFGYPVLRLQATDPDLGLNSEIRYQLLNERSRRFAIDPISGRVRALAAFERDSQRVYGFDVKATDKKGADDGMSAIANVFVYVLDESKQVVMVVGAGPIEVERGLNNMTAALRGATGLDVRVRLLEPHEGKGLEQGEGAGGATDVYIYAVDPRSNAVIDMQTLHKALKVEETSIRESLSPLPVLEVAALRPAVMSSRPGRVTLTGLELGAVALGVAVFAGALATALCLACVRRSRRIPKATFVRPQITGFLNESKRSPAVPTTGGLYSEAMQPYGEIDSYTEMSSKSQQLLCPHGNLADKERSASYVLNKNSEIQGQYHHRRGHPSGDQKSPGGPLEASVTSLYSSGRDSGIALGRTGQERTCECGHSDSSGSSNGSYEDSLKSSPSGIRQQQTFARRPSLPRQPIQRAGAHLRRGRHSFSGGLMRDDLTQGSPGLLQRTSLTPLTQLGGLHHMVHPTHAHRIPFQKSFRIRNDFNHQTHGKGFNSRLKPTEGNGNTAHSKPFVVELNIPHATSKRLKDKDKSNDRANN